MDDIEVFGPSEVRTFPEYETLRQLERYVLPVRGVSMANRRRRERVKAKAETTTRYIVAAVGIFERWLWATYPDDQRQIFEIPPPELNTFLADFFMTITKPSGDEYNRESFMALRSRLDSYLKDNDYPCSLSKSEQFAKSQVAFKMRCESLRLRVSTDDVYWIDVLGLQSEQQAEQHPQPLSLPGATSRETTRMISPSLSDGHYAGDLSAARHQSVNSQRRQKLMSKPANTIRFILAAVGTFERWFGEQHPNDRREIYDLSPVELDLHLENFFATVRKSSGEDYNRASFTALRSRLESYLKENGYPYSITRAPEFARSQSAFKLRKMGLR